MERMVSEALPMNIESLLTESLRQLNINNAALSLPYAIFRQAYLLELQDKPKQLLLNALSQLKADFLLLKRLEKEGSHRYAFKKRQIISSHALNLSKLQAKNNFSLINPVGE